MLRQSLGLWFAVSCMLVMCSTTLAHPPSKERTQVTHEPKFPKMELSILIIGYQGTKYDVSEGKGTSGCTLRFEPKFSHDPKVDYGATCGYPGEVSKVTCSYSHTDKDGDHYELTRQFPYQDIDQKTPKKKVTFQGKPMVVYEDQSHRVELRVQKPKTDHVENKK